MSERIDGGGEEGCDTAHMVSDNSEEKVLFYSSTDAVENEQECLFFGDFKCEDYDKYFLKEGVIGVEFLCDTYNATKSWVEGCKDTFDYLIPMDDESNTFPDSNEGFFTDENFNSDVETAVSTHTELNDELTELNIAERTTDNLVENVKEEMKTENKTKIIKPTTWASLFKTTDWSAETPNSNQIKSNQTSPIVISVQMDQNKNNTSNALNSRNSLSLISMDTDDRAHKLADFINQLTPNYNRHHLQLRGLINRCNWCYINTTLQALLGISPISHFYKSLKSFFNKSAEKSTSTPLTDSMIAFFNEFEPINPKIPIKKQTEDLRAAAPFEPKCIYDVLPVMKTTLSEKGRQEDAEEFLSFLLNGIHDELIALEKLIEPAPLVNGNCIGKENHENEDESWEHVGPKNKSSTMRKAVIEGSLIKHMFGGMIRSSVHQTGVKESTTLQPFFTLQLDIQSEKIWTLKDAIECYFTKENLQGFTCSKTNAEVEASRRTTLEELPVILIFHLKYFVFDRTGGCQKIHKAIDIPVDLEIPKDVMSPSVKVKLSTNMRNYKLYAVVYHHGKDAAGGHYTAAVHHGNPFGWVNFDDNQIKTVSVNQVLKHQTGCVPYLLFYERIQAREL